MMCGYLGLQFNRFGQSNRKNGVSILVKATVQFLTGSVKELNLFVEIWKYVHGIFKGKFLHYSSPSILANRFSTCQL